MDPLQSAAPAEKTFTRHFTEVTPLSKTLAAIVFIVLPFVGVYLGYHYAPAPEIILTDSVLTPPATTAEQTKGSFLGGEIPENWSVYTRSETPWVNADNFFSEETIAYSFGASQVSFPPNFEQVNIRFMTEDGGKNFINDASLHNIPVEQKSFDDVPLTLIRWPLDENGQATILGTGGTDYLMQIPIEHSAYPGATGYVMINKVGLGDEEFEEAFAHYLDTIDFKRAQTLDWIDYATMARD